MPEQLNIKAFGFDLWGTSPARPIYDIGFWIALLRGCVCVLAREGIFDSRVQLPPVYDASHDAYVLGVRIF